MRTTTFWTGHFVRRTFRLRRRRVSQRLSGLIGLWRAEGNTQDSIGSGNGVAVNAGYTSGIDGQAFTFDPENYPFGTYTGVADSGSTDLRADELIIDRRLDPSARG